MYTKRAIEETIINAGNLFPALIVTGARQVGKTTLLNHLCKNDRQYVSLDDPLVRMLAKDDPALFMKRYEPPLFIDEIQYAPELLPYIKIAIDSSSKKNLFWLSGSQPFHLMKAVTESLAGRAAIIQLYGLSQQEISGNIKPNSIFLPGMEAVIKRNASSAGFSLNELYQRIWRGSFPAIALNSDMNHSLFYSSYIQTYLQRDVRDLAKVGDETAFLRFLSICASRTGSILNLADLARDSDIKVNTAKNWLSILVSSGILFLLEPYHTNVSKRLIKAPKLYFLDTGLCSYLTGWTSPKTLESGAFSGAILETWVIVEILKSFTNNGEQAKLYYYRDKDQKEIDLLMIRDGIIHPLEIKKSASPAKRDISQFQVLNRLDLPVGEGGLLCLTDDVIPLADNICAIPISCI